MPTNLWYYDLTNGDKNMDDNLYIQILPRNGNWQTMSVIADGLTQMTGSEITRSMQGVQSRHPYCRVRAVDGNDRMVDML